MLGFGKNKKVKLENGEMNELDIIFERHYKQMLNACNDCVKRLGPKETTGSMLNLASLFAAKSIELSLKITSGGDANEDLKKLEYLLDGFKDITREVVLEDFKPGKKY